MKSLAVVLALGLVPGLAQAQWTESLPAEEAPAVQPQAVDGGTVPAGQWVYTQQYGWIWMPYGDAYSYVPGNGVGQPYEYVYYPSYGWTWVGAPWIWGYGAWPYFGASGPARFGWYGHGWWRSPARWTFRAGAVRPALGRPGFGGPTRAAGGGRGVGAARFAGEHYAAGRHVGSFRAGGGHAGGGRGGGGGHVAGGHGASSRGGHVGGRR